MSYYKLKHFIKQSFDVLVGDTSEIQSDMLGLSKKIKKQSN